MYVTGYSLIVLADDRTGSNLVLIVNSPAANGGRPLPTLIMAFGWK